MAETILEKHKFEVGTEVRLRDEDVDGVTVASIQEVYVSRLYGPGEILYSLPVYRVKLSALDTEVYVAATDLLARSTKRQKTPYVGEPAAVYPSKFTELEFELYEALKNFEDFHCRQRIGDIPKEVPIPCYVYHALAKADAI